MTYRTSIHASLLAALFLLCSLPPLVAQSGDAQKSTPFSERRGDETSSENPSGVNASSSAIAPTVPNNNRPNAAEAARRKVISRTDSPLYDTKWSFIRMPMNREGSHHFRPDGGVYHYDGVKNHPSTWTAFDPRDSGTKAFAKGGGELYYLEDDGITLLQIREKFNAYMRVWYLGESVPPIYEGLCEAISAPGVTWENGETDRGLSVFTFYADGTVQERWNGREKTGKWRPLCGGTIWLYGGVGEHAFSFIRNNTLAIKQIANGASVWKRVGPTPVSAPPVVTPEPATATTTATANEKTPTPTPVPTPAPAPGTREAERFLKPATPGLVQSYLAQEAREMKRFYSDEVDRLMKAQNELDLRKLEALKNRVGIRDIDFTKRVNSAMEAVSRSETPQIRDLGAGAEPHERDLHQIALLRTKAEKNISIGALAKTKRNYSTLAKRAYDSGNLDLADDVNRFLKGQTTIFTTEWPDCVLGRWKAANGAAFTIKREDKRIVLQGGKPRGTPDKEYVHEPASKNPKERYFRVGQYAGTKQKWFHASWGFRLSANSQILTTDDHHLNDLKFKRE